jgi:hypothetical protein
MLVLVRGGACNACLMVRMARAGAGDEIVMDSPSRAATCGSCARQLLTLTLRGLARRQAGQLGLHLLCCIPTSTAQASMHLPSATSHAALIPQLHMPDPVLTALTPPLPTPPRPPSGTTASAPSTWRRWRRWQRQAGPSGPGSASPSRTPAGPRWSCSLWASRRAARLWSGCGCCPAWRQARLQHPSWRRTGTTCAGQCYLRRQQQQPRRRRRRQQLGLQQQQQQQRQALAARRQPGAPGRPPPLAGSSRVPSSSRSSCSCPRPSTTVPSCRTSCCCTTTSCCSWRSSSCRG